MSSECICRQDAGLSRRVFREGDFDAVNVSYGWECLSCGNAESGFESATRATLAMLGADDGDALTLSLCAAYEHVDGFNVPADKVGVPVLIDPDLGPRGEVRTNPYGPPRTIVLREWDEQVLLHEVLHILMGTDDHTVLNRVEVGLMLAGWRYTGRTLRDPRG